MSEKSARMGGCVLLLALYWAAEILPLPVTALMPMILFPLLGLAPAKDVAPNYFKDTITLFVGSLMMAAAIESCGLHKRMALKVLGIVGTHERKLFGCGPVIHGMAFLMLGAMGAAWFLSMWISNTAATAMIIPIVRTMLSSISDGVEMEVGAAAAAAAAVVGSPDVGSGSGMNTESPLAAPREPVSAPSPLKESLVAGETGGTFDSEEVPAAAAGDTRPHMRPDIEKFGKGLLICVAYAASIGGISTLTGTPTNLVFTGDLDDFFRSGEQSRMLFDAPGSGGPVSFAKWMAFALPLSSTLLVIMWLVLFKMFGSQSLPTLPEEAVQRQYAALGPMRFGEGMVLAHFLVLALLWISQSFWSELFIYDGQKMVTSATPAVTIAVALFMAPAEPLGSRPGQPLRRCLDWKTAVTLPWGVVLLIGGGFALADGVNRSGLADWLGDQLLFLQSWPAVLVLLVVNFFMTFMTEFCSNVSTCTVMLPILKTIASIMKVHPYFLLIPGTISTSFAFMLPIATPPNAIAFSGGELVVMDMARPGLVANLLGICLTTVFT